jgi:hypothetical protein
MSTEAGAKRRHILNTSPGLLAISPDQRIQEILPECQKLKRGTDVRMVTRKYQGRMDRREKNRGMGETGRISVRRQVCFQRIFSIDAIAIQLFPHLCRVRNAVQPSQKAIRSKYWRSQRSYLVPSLPSRVHLGSCAAVHLVANICTVKSVKPRRSSTSAACDSRALACLIQLGF